MLASSGDQFSCFYTIQYSSKGVVSTKKTSVICDPDLDGGNVEEVFDLPKVGPTSIKHSIKKGKESIKKASAYSGSSSSSMVLPMNCSCKADFPHQLMEVIKPGEMMATGRGSAASRGGRGGGKGGVGFLLGPLLLVLLLPTFITSLQALLAGRSLNLDTLREELADKLADRLNSGEFGQYSLSVVRRTTVMSLCRVGRRGQTAGPARCPEDLLPLLAPQQDQVSDPGTDPGPPRPTPGQEA